MCPTSLKQPPLPYFCVLRWFFFSFSIGLLMLFFDFLLCFIYRNVNAIEMTGKNYERIRFSEEE